MSSSTKSHQLHNTMISRLSYGFRRTSPAKRAFLSPPKWRGYSGHLPTSLRPGDTIQILNIGGVLGVCDSANPDVGAPFDCEVLGTVLSFPYLGERIGVPARAGSSTLDPDALPAPSLAGCGTLAFMLRRAKQPAFRCGAMSSRWRMPVQAKR
jgi:hypothetical protein